MRRRSARFSGEIDPPLGANEIPGGKFSGACERFLGRRGARGRLARDFEFSLAPGRLRSGETGLHLFRDGAAGTLDLSAHSEWMGRDEAAARRLVFRWTFFRGSLVGTGVAASVVSSGTRPFRIHRPRGFSL